MYVCICTGTTEDEIKDSIGRGNNTMDALMDDLRVSLGCGMCGMEVERLLIETNQCGYRIPELDIAVIKSF